MKNKKHLYFCLILAGVAVLFLSGFVVCKYYQTQIESYSESEIKERQADLLAYSIDTLGIDDSQWHICSLDTVADTLKELFPEPDYQDVSKIIYEEYYNSSLDRGLTTLILISNDLDEVLIISTTSSDSILTSKCSLNNLLEPPKWVRNTST